MQKILRAAEGGIGAVQGCELFVGALLGDLPVDDDDDAAGGADGGQAVGDDERGAVAG